VTRFAYADPPYIGQAKKHYSADPQCAEVDHAELLTRLDRDFDGWALSASSPSLFQILPLCPEGTRIAAWVKPFASFKPGVNPAYAWEPVLFKSARKRGRQEPTVRDWHSANITLKRGLSGAKPESVCFWLFDLIGMQPADELTDLFPGTGAVTQAFDSWKRQRRLA
jgi:hypothetical protein